MGCGGFLEQGSSLPSASAPCRWPPSPTMPPHQCHLSHRGNPGLAGQHSCELLQLGAPRPGPQYAEPQQLLLDPEQQRAVAPGGLHQHHHGRRLQAPSRCGRHLVLGGGGPRAAAHSAGHTVDGRESTGLGPPGPSSGINWFVPRTGPS